MSLRKKILAFLSNEEPQEEVVKLSEQALEDGTVITSEDWSEGGAVFIKGEEDGDENIKLPVGDYILSDGKVLKVSEEGIIESCEYPEGEDEDEDKAEGTNDDPEGDDKKEELEEEESSEGDEPEMDTQVQELILVIASLEERIAALEGSLELSNKEANKPNDNAVALSSQGEEEDEDKDGKEDKKDDKDSKPFVHVPKDPEKKKSKFYFGKNS